MVDFFANVVLQAIVTVLVFKISEALFRKS